MFGATFKPDSDDVRDSPALDVAVALANAGATVVVHDPKGTVNAERVYPTLTYSTDVLEAAIDADLIIHATEWMEYREIDPAELSKVVSQKNIIDARNKLDVASWRAAGWNIRALGRPTA